MRKLKPNQLIVASWQKNLRHINRRMGYLHLGKNVVTPQSLHGIAKNRSLPTSSVRRDHTILTPHDFHRSLVESELCEVDDHTAVFETLFQGSLVFCPIRHYYQSFDEDRRRFLLGDKTRRYSK